MISGVLLLGLQPAIASSVEALAVVGIIVGVAFLGAAWWVRSQYLDAIYARLRTHALSLTDYQQAIGRPTQDEIAELQGYIRGDETRTRAFAAEALARMSPDEFATMLPELTGSPDPVVRRLAFQMGTPDRFTSAQLASGLQDTDSWVRAAAAVAGVSSVATQEVLARLRQGSVVEDRAAAAWAAGFVGDDAGVGAAMRDPAPRVRLEAIRSFARMKGEVADIAEPMVACLGDPDVEVRREALRQAVRWAPPADMMQRFEQALADALASADHDVRALAAEAMATQAPDALSLHGAPARGAGRDRVRRGRRIDPQRQTGAVPVRPSAPRGPAC